MQMGFFKLALVGRNCFVTLEARGFRLKHCRNFGGGCPDAAAQALVVNLGAGR